MAIRNIKAVEAYFNDRVSGDNSRILSTKKGNVVLVAKSQMDCIDHLFASFGCGKYALRNVIDCFNAQATDHFQGKDALTKKINQLVDTYNTTHGCFKNSERLVAFSQERLDNQALIVQMNAKIVALETKYIKNDAADIEELIEDCSELASSLTNLPKDKPTYSKVLNFKNCIRARYLPKKAGKTLKGPTQQAVAAPLSQDQADRLKEALKNVRREVLKNCFVNRRKNLKKELYLLRVGLKNHKDLFTPEKILFLHCQIQRAEKKLKEFKPFALYKYSHCTKTNVAHQGIVNGEIRYAHSGAYPGAFFSQKPADSVQTYGAFGIGFSSYAERTMINDPVLGKVYPTQSQWTNGSYIKYSDQVEPYTDGDPIPDPWLGAQRGQTTFVKGKNDPNQIGIPIHHRKKIQSEDALNYYKDTTLSHLFYRGLDSQERTTTRALALSSRVQCFTQDENDAWLTLIQHSIAFRFPSEWDGKIKAAV